MPNTSATKRDKVVKRTEQLLRLNAVVDKQAIPVLLQKGFSPTAFVEPWHGKDNLGSYTYYLWRQSSGSTLHLINLYASKHNMRIDITLNVLIVKPDLRSLAELSNSSILNFIVPPTSSTTMTLNQDEYRFIPIVTPMFVWKRMGLGTSRNEAQLERRIKIVSENVLNMCTNMDKLFVRWHELHVPNVVGRDGALISSL